MSKLQSKTQESIKLQIIFVYQHLIKLGYPKIVELTLIKSQEIQSYLSAYFQCTPSRMQLIEWLIAVILPEYREMSWYITQKDPLNKIIKSLWRVGVMLVNKHTKNLDYKKYVQATLGYENSVNLIYNLTQLAFQTVLAKKSKNDVSFGQFLHELTDNFTDLVNQNYDIYGITFPCKFVNLNQVIQKTTQQNDDRQQFLDQFQKQYMQFYENKMVPLLQKQDELLDKIYIKKNKNQQMGTSLPKCFQSRVTPQQTDQGQLGQLIQKISQYGDYDLVHKIQSLIQTPQIKSRLIPYYLQAKQESQTKRKQTVKMSVQNRSVRISPEFCTKYRNYKRTLRQIKTSKDDKEFMDSRKQTLDLLQKINESVSL